MTALNRPFTSQQALIVRLLAGAGAGLIIAWLIGNRGTGIDSVPPDRVREVLINTIALLTFVIWAGAGSMRLISLGVWKLVAFLIIGTVCWFSTYDGEGQRPLLADQAILILPLLFIAHELVSSGDQAGQLFAPYATYFDEAWKRGVQLALAVVFTLLFWGILWLGATLLGFIGFEWLKDLLQNDYFSWPITGLALGAAVHLGDVQTTLLANVRNLVLGVLAWLLPVITLIGAIFAASLLVSGLEPLWATKAATASLLGGCISFVLLINAAYQQGDVERSVPFVLKWCVRAGALLLLIFAVLAALSLGLRIDQYGLTADRVFAGLGVVIALAYGVGYSAAVFVPGRWMGLLDGLNIGLAILKVVLFIAILTPIAAPNRLTVNDQIARLTSGKVSIDKFDWWLLKDDTATYGKAGLTRLAASANPAIATKAKAALANEIGERPSPYRERNRTALSQPIDPTRIPVVFPTGAQLPASFLATDFNDDSHLETALSCLKSETASKQDLLCKAALLDLNQDGVAEVLIREGPRLAIFALVKGDWIGNADYVDIGPNEADFDAGKLQAAPSMWRDVVINGKKFPVKSLPSTEPAVISRDQTKAPPPSK